MTVENLRQLFLHELQTAYYIEEELIGELQEMVSDTTDEDLRDILENKIGYTSDHVVRLEDVFTEMGEKSSRHQLHAFDGLREDLDYLRGQITEPKLINFVLFDTMVKITRLEVSIYENLLMLSVDAEGEKEIRALLETNLEEEKEMIEDLEGLKEDSSLTRLIGELRA